MASRQSTDASEDGCETHMLRQRTVLVRADSTAEALEAVEVRGRKLDGRPATCAAGDSATERVARRLLAACWGLSCAIFTTC